MIIVAAALLAVLTVPLSGRSLGPLARLSLRRVWLVWTTIAVQLIITLLPAFPESAGRGLHLLTFAAAAVFIWSNRRIPGTTLIALGAGLNVAAIALNGGTMPASSWAWRTAGLPLPADGFTNSTLTQSARLEWLGDVFAIPRGWPLANVFSIGDVVIIVGVCVLAHGVCRASDPRAGGDEERQQLGGRGRNRGASRTVVEHHQIAPVEVDDVRSGLTADHH